MRIFVSNLPAKTTETDLRRLFANHGKVVKAWLTAPAEEGGHGFVEMSFGEAQVAIRALNRSWYKNRRLNVQKSRFIPGRQQRHSENSRVLSSLS